MYRRVLLFVTGLVASLALAAAASGLPPCFGVPRTATLTGAAEAPTKGDEDGAGKALIQLNLQEGLVCWTLTVRNIVPAAAAHIHKGAAGVAGPVVVPLGTPAGGGSKGCTSAARSLIKDIRDNPGQYYVNVHNKDFPGGAVRGQLAK